MLTKHCLQEFKLDCQLRRLSDRTIKGYYNNTLNFLVYAEKHHEILLSGRAVCSKAAYQLVSGHFLCRGNLRRLMLV